MRIPTKKQVLLILLLVIGSTLLAGFQSNPPNDESGRRAPASHAKGITRGSDDQPPHGGGSIPPPGGTDIPPGGDDNPGPQPGSRDLSFGGWREWLLTGFSGLLLLVTYLLKRYVERRFENEQKAKLSELEKKAEVEPEKLKPVWELARFTLESYFKRNLNQVRNIFYVSITAMIAGFGVIFWGVKIAVGDPNQVKVSVVAAASGVLTEFISLTFMAIYRSTLGQANQYVAVLERINSVGMAVQILDSMAKDSEQLKDATRAEIIRLLLSKPLVAPPKPDRIRQPKAAS